MADKKGFDLGGFHAALNAQRATKGLTWKDVAMGVGYQPVHIDSDVPRKTS